MGPYVTLILNNTFHRGIIKVVKQFESTSFCFSKLEIMTIYSHLIRFVICTNQYHYFNSGGKQ